MNLLWKTLLGLAVVLPLGGYVAGTVAASDPADDLQPRDTIVIRDTGHQAPSGERGGDGRGADSRKKGADDRKETEGRTGSADDSHDDLGSDDDGDDVDTVEIEPDEVDDDSGPGSHHSGSDDRDDDRSGHGSGEDD